MKIESRKCINISKIAEYPSELTLLKRLLKFMQFQGVTEVWSVKCEVKCEVWSVKCEVSDFWVLQKNMNWAFPLKIFQCSQENTCVGVSF